MDIVEKMKNMDIVEKMNNWDTWESMVKDLRPYLDEVQTRVENKDDSIIQDFYVLELITETWVNEQFSNAINELLNSVAPDIEAYNDVVADIMKLHSYSDKLNDVLEAHPQLTECVRYCIRRDWFLQDCKKQQEKQQGGEKQQGVEDLVVEDSKMEEYFKEKCDVLGNIGAKLELNNSEQQKIRDFSRMIYEVRVWVRIQEIFKQALPELHNKYKECIQNMMPDSCREDLALKEWLALSKQAS